MKLLLISLLTVLFIATLNVSAQIVGTSGVTTGPIDQVYQARLVTIASLSGQTGEVTVIGGLAAYPVRIHLINAYCAINASLVITDGGAVVLTDSLIANTNYLRTWWYPGLISATNQLKVTAGPCGVGNKVYMHIAYSP